MRQKRDPLLYLLALGDVFDDGRKILGLAVRIANADTPRAARAMASHRRVQFVFLISAAAALLQRFGVGLVHEFRALGAVDLENSPVEKLASRHIEHGLKRPVNENVFPRLGVFRNESNGNVLDERIQELLCLVQLPLRLSQLGDVLMSRDPAAALKRTARDANEPAVGMLVDSARHSISSRRFEPLPDIRVMLVALEHAVAQTIRDDLIDE